MTNPASSHRPDGTEASKHRPRDSRTRTAAPPLTVGIKRENKASPLPETSNETKRRDGNKCHARRDERRNEQSRHHEPRPTRRMITMRRASTPRPRLAGHRRTRRETRRQDETKRREAERDDRRRMRASTPPRRRTSEGHSASPRRDRNE